MASANIANLEFLMNELELTNFGDSPRPTTPPRQLIRSSLKNLTRITQTRDLQLYALRINPEAIRYIEPQTHELALMAVKKNGLVIEYIVDQTDSVCLAAVRQNPKAIAKIRRPSIKLHLRLVEVRPKILLYHNAPEQVCCHAVKRNPNNIRFITEPSLAVCLLVVGVKPIPPRAWEQLSPEAKDILASALVQKSPSGIKRKMAAEHDTVGCWG